MKFLDSQATPADFVAALRRYIGVPHSPSGSIIKETPEGPKGFLRCVGLPLAALRDCGFLPAGFPLSQSDAALLSLLHENAACAEQLRVGDLFFVRIPGSDEKHIAVFTEARGEWGRYIHCLNDVRGKGRVWEADMSAFERDSIESIYRLKAWPETERETVAEIKAGAFDG